MTRSLAKDKSYPTLPVCGVSVVGERRREASIYRTLRYPRVRAHQGAIDEAGLVQAWYRRRRSCNCVYGIPLSPEQLHLAVLLIRFSCCKRPAVGLDGLLPLSN